MPSTRPSTTLRGDRGAGTIEYVGVLLVVVSVLASLLAASPVMASTIACRVPPLVDAVLSQPVEEPPGCGATDAAEPDDPTDPGDPTDPTDPDEPRDPDGCAEGVVVAAGGTYVGLDCRLVPLPEECGPVEPATATPEQEIAARDCAAGTNGPPSTDQEDPSCQDATPSGVPDEDPTTVQIGCRDWVVPIDCAEPLEALRAADPASLVGVEASQTLQRCVSTWYERNETPCVVGQSLDVDRFEVVAMFFIKIAGESAFLVEELGDGRMRVHLLNGTEFGVELSTPDGAGPSAEVGFLSGFETDKTYEFADKAAAQDWIDWHQEVRDAYSPGVYMGTWGGYRPPSYDEVRDEPARREHSTAETEKTKVRAKFTVDGSIPIGEQPADGSADQSTSRKPTKPPRGAFTGATEVEVEQEVETEDRLLTDPPGGRVQTYKTSDRLAAAMLLQLGGKAGRFGVDLKAALEGGSVKGTLSVTQVRRADGSLDRLVVTVDDTLMNTLYDIGVDVSVMLPHGFSAEGGWSRKGEEGTAKVVQTVLPIEGLDPAQAARADELANAIFPREDDGTLEDDDVDLDSGFDELGDLVEANGTTRTVDYGVQRTTETSAGGLSFAGLPLLQVTQIELQETQDLTASELEVVDVTGRTRVVSPAPACDAKDVDPATYPYDPPADRLVWDDDDLVTAGERDG